MNEMPPRSTEQKEQTPDTALEVSRAAIEELEQEATELITELEAVVAGLDVTTEAEAEQAVSVLEYFSMKINAKVKAFALTSALFFPSPSEGEVLTETVQDGKILTQEIEQASATIDERIEQLREKVWTDDFETLYYYYGRESDLEEILHATGAPKTYAVMTTYKQDVRAMEDIDRIKTKQGGLLQRLKGNINNDPMVHVSLHNHTMTSMAIALDLPDSVVEEMRAGTRPMLVAPPSVTDVEDNVPRQKTKADNYHLVFEPSGTWLMDIDESHPTHKQIQRIKYQYELDLENLDNDDEGQITVGRKTPAQLLDDMCTKLQEIEEERDHLYNAIQKTAEKIREASIAGEDVQPHIYEYFDLGSKLGYNITYTPTNGEPISYQQVLDDSDTKNTQR